MAIVAAPVRVSVAKQFVQQGAQQGAIVAMRGRYPEALDTVVKEAVTIGGKTIHQTCDVASGEQAYAFVYRSEVN